MNGQYFIGMGSSNKRERKSFNKKKGRKQKKRGVSY
jgi:hypothetical protein